jgi:hypothetical protein
MDPLSRLFGSPARLKLLRLFYFNDDTAYPSAEAAFRAKVPDAAARKEIALLMAAGAIKKKTVKSGTVYEANKKFEYYDQLLVFLRSTTSMKDGDVVDLLKKAGTLRAVVLAGVFTGSVESKVDILVVGDSLQERALKAAIHTIEAELGRELRYAAFTTPDFRYRLGVYDRLIRDVMDYSHRTVLDKLGLKA